MTILQLHVLVVDDDEACRALLAELLTAWGARVRTAASAREAREAFADARPDVLISDIELPDEDGYALIRELRRVDDRLHAIACTSRAGRQDHAHALACGFDSVVAKPLDVHALRRALGQGAGIAGRWPTDTEVSPTRDS